MSYATLSLLNSVEKQVQGPENAKVFELLGDPEAEFVATEPALERVSQLLPTLKARLKTSSMNGIEIYGLEPVIKKLQNLPETTIILGYGIKSPTSIGNIYVDECRRKLFGAAIVCRRQN